MSSLRPTLTIVTMGTRGVLQGVPHQHRERRQALFLFGPLDLLQGLVALTWVDRTKELSRPRHGQPGDERRVIRGDGLARFASGAAPVRHVGTGGTP